MWDKIGGSIKELEDGFEETTWKADQRQRNRNIKCRLKRWGRKWRGQTYLCSALKGDNTDSRQGWGNSLRDNGWEFSRINELNQFLDLGRLLSLKLDT